MVVVVFVVGLVIIDNFVVLVVIIVSHRNLSLKFGQKRVNNN